VKKGCHLFLLIPVLLHAGGMLLICILLQVNVQLEAFKTLKKPETHLEKLTLTIDEYRQSRIDEHEVKVNGKMYDVKEKIFHKNHVVLLAFHDVKEENVISVIGNCFSGSRSSNKQIPAHVLKLLVSVYTLPGFAVSFLELKVSELLTGCPDGSYHSFSSDTASPPPEGKGLLLTAA
jgi:hypothetical protein